MKKRRRFFVISFFVSSGCGGTFIKPQGEFKSPNYPNIYPPNTECEYYITVDPSMSIVLTIQDISFEALKDCFGDALEVAQQIELLIKFILIKMRGLLNGRSTFLLLSTRAFDYSRYLGEQTTPLHFWQRSVKRSQIPF